MTKRSGSGGGGSTPGTVLIVKSGTPSARWRAMCSASPPTGTRKIAPTPLIPGNRSARRTDST